MSHSLSPLLTDLYQITMAQAYYLNGREGGQASFSVSFRENPFNGGYIIASGIEEALDFLQDFGFSEGDIAYLASLKAGDGSVLFQPEFLEHLAELRFEGEVECVREGSLVFPREPVFKVSGPIEQCQLIETTVLNLINFSSLVSTKAMRCRLAAKGDRLLEFGLRRAQGPNGGITAARASYIGGFHASSNVIAGKRYGIPVAGTHAHSWVMSFESELEAFRAYAETSPNNVILLVDTYDTIQGVKNAIIVADEMKVRGEKPLGIRLDSGDLAWLSIQARELLDAAGHEDLAIYATNELDEYTIESLKNQGAKIDVWGVGTKLVTCADQPAMGGVYKLSAVQDESGTWQPRIKFSEQIYKMTFPGRHKVRRFVSAEGRYIGDMIYDPSVNDPNSSSTDAAVGSSARATAACMIDPFDSTRSKSFAPGTASIELLELAFKDGARIWEHESLEVSRARAIESIEHIDVTQTRLLNPHSYPVGLECELDELRHNLIKELRATSPKAE